MRSGLTLLALAVAAAASGCKKDDPTPRPVGAPTATPTPPPATPPPTATATATALPTAGRWDCVKDLDCTNSCEYGAVNRAWYTKNVPNEPCEDGCDGPWSDNPQCIDSGCVAFQNGKRAPSCTRRLRE